MCGANDEMHDDDDARRCAFAATTTTTSNDIVSELRRFRERLALKHTRTTRTHARTQGVNEDLMACVCAYEMNVFTFTRQQHPDEMPHRHDDVNTIHLFVSVCSVQKLKHCFTSVLYDIINVVRLRDHNNSRMRAQAAKLNESHGQ